MNVIAAGLKSPRVVQKGLNEATILSLVSHGMGVGWVNGTARWRCPESVVIVQVGDLDMPLPLALAWRNDNSSHHEGLVAFDTNPHHKRAQLVVLTEKGKHAFDAAMRLQAPWTNDLAKGLSAKDIQTFHSVISVLREKLETNEPEEQS